MQLSEFDYHLPETRIAQYPLSQRDASKLLVYQSGEIMHSQFADISKFLNQDDLLIFNDTKVIPARMFFKRSSGARIEVFLLDPIAPFNNMEQMLKSEGPVEWNCIIGNLKKWKDGETILCELPDGDVLEATLVDRTAGRVRFSWPSGNFADILIRTGRIPLPPYIDRQSEELDSDRYQTVYAEHDGAVAAPTAGLHFTDRVISDLGTNGVQIAHVTLHVGAGTFQPVKESDVRKHNMHEEVFMVDRSLIQSLRNAKRRIATGTTSLRAIDSLYWMGVKAATGAENVLELGQFEYEDLPGDMSYGEALGVLDDYLKHRDLEQSRASTAIMIMPGYKIRSISGLITNFHLPKSTLIMLIASWVGNDWRRIYQEALDNGYRFLSYGDSSLLF